jgi:hypothetical protein
MPRAGLKWELIIEASERREFDFSLSYVEVLIIFSNQHSVGWPSKIESQNNHERLHMNIKKKIFLKLSVVALLLAINIVALAATPRTPCSIRARVAGLLSVTLPGRVGTTGQFCQPTGSLPDILTPLRTGVDCFGQEYVLFLITVKATCPN